MTASAPGAKRLTRPSAKPVQVGPPPPTDDKRWRIVDATMRRHGHAANALIETLHSVQETFGFLDEPSLRYASAALSVPLSKVYGVATFYHFFTLKPKGKHACVVCQGTACYIKGSAAILAGIKEAAGIGPGETTPDNKMSVLTARCLGACGLAPAAVFDGEVMGRLGPGEVMDHVKEWLSDDS
jgi:bidirectional [NiFe] hydrogenase diaphorase subunit